MIAHKHITKWIAAIMAAAVTLCVFAVAFSGKITAAAGSTGISMAYESALFDTDSVLQINILMDETDWTAMLENATAEEYYPCDVEVNGTTFYRVGIRPKGNTSLTSIANDPTTDRYSFKLEFDHYVDGQTCFGLDKLVLNNNYADATNMKEALIYDMYQYLGADASLYNYAKISVNGDYWGVYLALEAVEDSFLLRNYGTQDGALYKPEGVNGGGGQDKGGFQGNAADLGGEDFSGMTPPDAPKNTADGGSPTPPDSSTRPAAGFAMTGGMGGFSASGGADLNYSDDDLSSYETIWDGAITQTTKSDRQRVVTALKNIAEGSHLETYMDIDNLLRYMAVHIFSVNEDSLSGTMAHNYYLYEANGQLNLLPWDYNLALGGMGGSKDAGDVVNSAIDNAFAGTQFFDALLSDETYHSRYYAYLQQLVSEYVDGGGFDAFYERVRSQLDRLVEDDPTAFYSYDEYLTAADTLYQAVKLRSASVQGQLSGTIPSTAEAQRSSDALVDASALDLRAMGYMNNGGGFEAPNASADGEASSDSAPADTEESPAPTAPAGAADPQPPSGFDPAQAGGDLPENFDPSQFGGKPQTPPDGTQQPSSDGTQPSPPDSTQQPPSNPSAPSADASGGSTQAGAAKSLLWCGISLLILIVALVFAIAYRRKPRR